MEISTPIDFGDTFSALVHCFILSLKVYSFKSGASIGKSFDQCHWDLLYRFDRPSGSIQPM